MKIKILTQRGHLMLVNLKIVMIDAVTKSRYRRFGNNAFFRVQD